MSGQRQGRRRWDVITSGLQPLLSGVALLLAIAATGSSVEAALNWSSPDGSIVLTLHDGWERAGSATVRPYNPRALTSLLPGSLHRLYTGGFPTRRYISLGVAHLPALRGDSASQFVELLAAELRREGLEVVRKYFDGLQKGFVHYRFLYSSDPVAQYAIVVGTDTGLFYVEVTADRQDEQRLQGEALQVMQSIVVRRPYQ